MILKKLEETGNQLIGLVQTKNLTDEDGLSEFWLEFKKNYKEGARNRWVHKAAISILNAAVYQNRGVFILYRSGAESVVRGDKNWEKRVGFSPKNYKSLIWLLINSGNIELIRKGKHMQPSVYKIINPILKKELKDTDWAAQEKEAILYSKNKGPASEEEASDFIYKKA